MIKTLGTHNYYVYILTNFSKTVFYTGMTNDLVRRLEYHRTSNPLNKKAFTSKYKCFYLIHFEHFKEVELAIKREKQIKGWTRIKKESLISISNPEWKFLNNEIQ